jgi:hypothetical protein
MKIRDQEIVHARFDSAIPNALSASRLETVRGAVRDCVDAILSCCHEGRAQAIALTKLEEASMWANKAITHKEK